MQKFFVIAFWEVGAKMTATAFLSVKGCEGDDFCHTQHNAKLHDFVDFGIKQIAFIGYLTFFEPLLQPLESFDTDLKSCLISENTTMRHHNFFHFVSNLVVTFATLSLENILKLF